MVYPSLIELTKIEFDPNPQIKDLLQCSFNILQIPYEEYINEKQAQVIDWKKCKRIIVNELQGKIEVK